MKRVFSILVLLTLTLMMLVGTANAIPNNSHTVGQNWECNIGYERQGQQCNKILIPSNPQEANLIRAEKYYEEGRYSNALSLLKPLANQGNSRAQLVLGSMHYFSHGVTKDIDKAVYWFNKSSDQGNLTAQYFLGKLYYNGTEVKKDNALALRLLHKSVKGGHVEAQFLLGGIYILGEIVPENYSKGISLMTKSGERGYVRAQYSLGNFYNDEGDQEKAVYWWQKASNKGHAESQHLLGISYQMGKGVLKDPKAAVYWYKKSADLGNANAQMKVSVFYHYGRGGLPRDSQKSQEFLDKAAAKGHPDAQLLLGIAYCDGKTKTIKKNLPKCASLVKKAHEKGVKEAKKTWDMYKLWKYQ